jgi:hypothetical protein
MISQARFENKNIFFNLKKCSDCYNAGVVVVNSEVAGLCTSWIKSNNGSWSTEYVGNGKRGSWSQSCDF